MEQPDKEIERIERIERYLGNKLSEEERKTFEQDLETDEELATELALEKSLVYVLNEQDVNQLRAQMQSSLKEHQKKKSNFVLFKQRNWIVAAAILVLIIGSLVILKNIEPSSEKLFHAYFEVPKAEDFMDPALFEDRSVGINTEDALFQEVARHYQNKKYLEALNVLESIIPTSENQAFYKYQLGIIYLVNNKEKEAIKALEAGQSWNINGAIWYQSLAYLALNQKEKAKQNLTKLMEINNPWQKQSQELYKQL